VLELSDGEDDSHLPHWLREEDARKIGPSSVLEKFIGKEKNTMCRKKSKNEHEQEEKDTEWLAGEEICPPSFSMNLRPRSTYGRRRWKK